MNTSLAPVAWVSMGKDCAGLPNELWCFIFRKVDIQTGVRCRGTCKLFKELIDGLVGIQLQDRNIVGQVDNSLQSKEILKVTETEKVSFRENHQIRQRLEKEFRARELFGRAPDNLYRGRLIVNGYEVGYPLHMICRKKIGLFPVESLNYKINKIGALGEWVDALLLEWSLSVSCTWSLVSLASVFTLLPLTELTESLIFGGFKEVVHKISRGWKWSSSMMAIAWAVFAFVAKYKPFLLMDVDQVVMLPGYAFLIKFFVSCYWRCSPGVRKKLELPFSLGLLLMSGLLTASLIRKARIIAHNRQ